MSSEAKPPIWQVDAFANGPFTGNPAAVCILGSFPIDLWMQNVAAEMNLSETAFVVPAEKADSFHLRWFTPATEVDLCGHATLAAAHVLYEQCHVETDRVIRFQSRSGELPCRNINGQIRLNFPATPATDDVNPNISRQLLDTLGIDTAEVLQTRFDLVVVCKDESVVESLHPDFGLLGQIDTRGVIVTSRSLREGTDFISRFFAPRCGINEDPVTGSAHCCLAPLWKNRLGKTSLVGHQASRRSGTVHCEVIEDRVRLSGTAVTVMEGNLCVPVS